MSILTDPTGEFVVLLPGETTPTTYTNYNDIPDEIDTVVRFQAEVPPAPHSINDHQQIADIEVAFDALLDRSVDAGARLATRVGDPDSPHCSGMVRAVGSPNVFVNGIPWSRQGDSNTPHLIPGGEECVIHAAPISTGSATVRINGIGAGRVGDPTCTKVAGGSPNVKCGG